VAQLYPRVLGSNAHFQAGDTRASNVKCAQCTNFQRTLGISSDERLSVFKMHVIQIVWPFYRVLRIIKKIKRSRRCGYTQLTVNDIFMASATHYIPISEKTVINSLITAASAASFDDELLCHKELCNA
jgi:hypothetical protein